MADNANSSCMSCHGTASVPDSTFRHCLLAKFTSNMTYQSVAPVNGLVGLDRSGSPATVKNDVSFSEMDAILRT
jgi:hypothetical protein